MQNLVKPHIHIKQVTGSHFHNQEIKLYTRNWDTFFLYYF